MCRVFSREPRVTRTGYEKGVAELLSLQTSAGSLLVWQATDMNHCRRSRLAIGLFVESPERLVTGVSL